LNPNDIISLYCTTNSIGNGYCLKAIMNDGKHRTILDYVNQEKALLVERHIGEYLDKPISGKVPI
jgi:hypothetical protein